MARVAVFGGSALKRRLNSTAGAGVEYEFLPLPARRTRLDPASRQFAGALIEAGPETKSRTVHAVRRAFPARPVGGVTVAPDASALRRLARLDLDFTVEIWRPGDPPAAAVLAHLQGAKRGRGSAAPVGETLKATA